MKYLAFDIEAANGYKLYSICSIGVVVADEKFNILHRENIWINPKSAYNLNGTRKNVGIDLHLDKKLLNSSPDFSQVYSKIKSMLTDPEVFVVGHAVDSDVRMLNAACKRYNLPSIDFEFTCSQLLYRLYKGEKEVKALSKIAAEFNITYNEHNSEDDAWMSLMTLKYLTEDSGMTVGQLAQKYRVRSGSNVNFDLVRPVSLEGQVSKKNQTKQATERICAFAQNVKPKNQLYAGKVFCFARSLELSDSDTLYALVRKMAEGGGRYSPKLIKCNVYVTGEFSTRQDQMRFRRVEELRSQGIVEVKNVFEILEGRTHMKQVSDFLERHEQSASQINAEEQIARFTAQIENGLRQNGACIPMIPTYLCNVDRSKIKHDKRVLIDAGGTNFRSAVGFFDSRGKAQIQNLSKTAMPASGGEVLSKKDFYDRVAQNIAQVADLAQDVGFCFSYPVNMGADMDGEVLGFSKEVRAPEVVGTRVGAETLKALKRYSVQNRKIVILNDTVATLLGGMAIADEDYSAYLGYIYGTGTNLCCVADTALITKVQGLPRGKMLINMECGGYDGFSQGDFDKAAIKRTDNPDKQLFEKMTSGRYLSEIIYEALCVARQEGEFRNGPQIEPFVLKDVSDFLVGEGKLCQTFVGADLEFALEVCKQLIERAAKMGAIANAATAAFTCTDKSLPVAIVAEGTTFHRLVGYRENFVKYLDRILQPQGISYRLLQGEELNLVGTLMATMAL
ncbi:MAG: exonuclease domain-containing protein [Corallococcus sp.]|nr:exonuclease domain-containing protein [Corallococcus sp.]MCM1360039.1 exonuclease domain-containing protein [Corallococcus sp.]MCM1395596.1 exonuclease domain-containing protein [Corallococcus sp.]